MTIIYVGTSSDYCSDKWDLHPAVSNACDIVRLDTNAKSVSFVCNSFGCIFPGDVYMVTLKDTDCVEFYILRTGLTIVPTEQVQEYLSHR